MVKESFRRASVPAKAWRTYERGDAFLFVVDPATSTAHLLDQFVLHVARRLRDRNRLASAAGRMALRAAAHAGEVTLDETGASGSGVDNTFRLADSDPVRGAVAVPGCDLALIVSDDVYNNIRQAPEVIGPEEFRETHVQVKEYEARAWILTRPSQAGSATSPGMLHSPSKQGAPGRDFHVGSGVFIQAPANIHAPMAGRDQTISYGAGSASLQE